MKPTHCLVKSEAASFNALALIGSKAVVRRIEQMLILHDEESLFLKKLEDDKLFDPTLIIQ